MRGQDFSPRTFSLFVISTLTLLGLGAAASPAGVTASPIDSQRLEQPVPNIEIGAIEYHPSIDSRPTTAKMSDLARAGSRLSSTDRHSLGPLSLEEYTLLASDYDASPAGERLRRLKIGIVRKLTNPVSLTGHIPVVERGSQRSVMGGLLERDPGGRLAWTTSFSSLGTEGLRLCLTDVSLPRGSRAFVYNLQGEVHGPYTFDPEVRTEGFWTNAVFSEEVFLEIQFGPGAESATDGIRLIVASVLHIQQQSGPLRGNDIRRSGQLSDTCFVNETCVGATEFPNISLLSRATAELSFVDAGLGYVCSGALLNDMAGDGIPYLLTANHCFSTPTVASSLEAYFQYITANCYASFPSRSTAPRTNGASLLATSTTSDFTLVRLAQSPPADSVFLGWTTADYSAAGGVSAYRISHPYGWPQFYSRHVISGVPSPGQCTGAPQGPFIYSKGAIGGTAGGSSGSLLCLPEGKVIGQLLGSCGTNLNDNCDSFGNSTLDGAFRTTYSAVAQWLNPSGSSSLKAGFGFSPATPSIGQSVNFTDSSTGGPTAWYWSFGDGFSSSAQNPTHPFSTAGTVGVTLTVTNSNGSDQLIRALTVTGSPPSCLTTAATVCLSASRFRVRVDWRVPSQGTSGTGNAVTLTGDTGYFWFFSPGNVELVVKVVDGRALNNHFWVFYGALSDVGYTITVTDTQTGAVQTYTNAQGRLASGADVTAF